MDEFTAIASTSSVIKLGSQLQKLYTIIRENREKKVFEHQIKEIESLKTLCRSENVLLCSMGCQTFVRLVEDGYLDATNVLAIFISMVSSVSPTQFIVISGGILDLLILSLKRKVGCLKNGETYQNQYGLKTHQHPIITLLQNPGVNMNDITNKIVGICHHQDHGIRNHSVEYLRPVFLYVFCNPHILPDSKTVWTKVLSLCKTNTSAINLILEILSWSKIRSTETALFTSILLIEATDYFLQLEDFKQSIDLCIYQALLVKSLVQFGIDPRPSLQCILRSLHSTRGHTGGHYNVLLILFAESVHLIPPNYLADLLRPMAFIIVKEGGGHPYFLNMCLDGIIQWMSQTFFIPAEGLALAHQIVRYINNQTVLEISTKYCFTDFKTSSVRNYHPDIALAFDLTHLVESIADSETKDIFNFVDSLKVKTNSMFCQKINLFLRALFLSRDLSADCWYKVYEDILDIIKLHSNIAYDFLMTYLFKLAGELIPEIQMELLKGLPNFAVSKDNIPMILNTIRNLTDENPTFTMDLYLKIWRIEPRTYPFLVKIISMPPKNSNCFEFEIAKTFTIREICREKPTQHAADLISHLSNVLNSCTDESGDLATSMALDAIVALCESHSVKASSTWTAIGGKFKNEKRTLTLKSLYKFFSIIPLLQTPNIEFDELIDEALDKIWLTISAPESEPDIVRDALAALRYYELNTIHTFRHIPPKFREDVKSFREYSTPDGREILDLQQDMIPGEVWVQLLRKVRPECGNSAADLVAHYIFTEIQSFRSGVYRLPEGKPEPRKLQGLFNHSPLRAVVSYLVNNSRFGERFPEPLPITLALRTLSKKFTKPIPPLDWSFLHCYFNLSFESRKYCIQIATNQLLHSGTARRLLENFLIEFEPNCFEKDLLLLLSLFTEIANNVSLHVLKKFAEKVAVYCFKVSQLNGFNEGCLFENFLDSVKNMYARKFEISEAEDLFNMIVERYMDSMDLDSKLFQKYTEVVAAMNSSAIENLTSPSNSWEISLGKLKKSTIIRCYLVLYDKELCNPLKWLNPIIDAFTSRKEEHLFLFRHLAATLYAFESDEHSCNWIMEHFLQIQTLLAESSMKEKFEKALFLIDIFILSVVVLSGCAVLMGNLDSAASQKQERFEIFPESMQILCDHIFWKDHESKIYEFLYNLYKNPVIPDIYGTIFKDAIICSRNKPYFDNKAIWTKYTGLRR